MYLCTLNTEFRIADQAKADEYGKMIAALP